MGFATQDFSALRYLRDRITGTDLYRGLDMIADPDDPRNLYGMIPRIGAAPPPC